MGQDEPKGPGSSYVQVRVISSFGSSDLLVILEESLWSNAMYNEPLRVFVACESWGELLVQ